MQMNVAKRVRLDEREVFFPSFHPDLLWNWNLKRKRNTDLQTPHDLTSAGLLIVNAVKVGGTKLAVTRSM